MYGGNNIELDEFRIEIGRPVNKLKINNLRKEILSINL